MKTTATLEAATLRVRGASSAPVPSSTTSQETGSNCGGSGMGSRSKWLIAAIIVLALAVGVAGSLTLGVAILLPLLFLLPCLVMAAMCMRKNTGSGSS